MAPLLDKLHSADVNRLSGGATTVEAREAAEKGVEGEAIPLSVALKRRNDQSKVDAARERFVSRKNARLR